MRRASLALLLTLGTSSLSAQLGTVHFKNSGSPLAQEAFIRGVLLLHSFEYGDAAEAFREAQRIDSSFAMAYWGEAMTYNHPVWFEQDRDAALAALARLAPTAEARLQRAGTERERDYLRAVHVLYGDGSKATRDTLYAAAMRGVMMRNPDDLEAAAFYALSLIGTSHGGRDVPTYMRAAAVAEEVFRANPNHPGAAHYLIHSYDDPIHAPLGLRAARAYAGIAPAASHAQHMTSHIFVALGMWDDVVEANEVSFEVSERRNYHALYWLEYGYLQQGRVREALDAWKIIRERPRSGREYLTSGWATYVIGSQAWDNPRRLAGVAMSEDEILSSNRSIFADGYLAIRTGDDGRAGRRIQDLAKWVSDATSDRRQANQPSVLAAQAMQKELEAMHAWHSGERDAAVQRMREAADFEDEMPFEFGPPTIIKPTHELFGELWLELDRPSEAYEEFQRALTLAPERALSLLGLARAAVAMGDHDRAATAYEKLRAIWYRADADLAELAEVRDFVATDSSQ